MYEMHDESMRRSAAGRAGCGNTNGSGGWRTKAFLETGSGPDEETGRTCNWLGEDRKELKARALAADCVDRNRPIGQLALHSPSASI